MAEPTVYIETTIPSFYYEDRTDAAAVARREWTRRWWTERRSAYKVFTSAAVLEELEDSDYPKQGACIRLIKDVPFVSI